MHKISHEAKRKISCHTTHRINSLLSGVQCDVMCGKQTCGMVIFCVVLCCDVMCCAMTDTAYHTLVREPEDPTTEEVNQAFARSQQQEQEQEQEHHKHHHQQYQQQYQHQHQQEP